MKRYVKSTTIITPLVISVIFDIELVDDTSTIAAVSYKGHIIPEGELPPADKNAIVNSQIWSDYQSFIEAVEDIIEDYDLDVYYKNNSDYSSFYWSALAKDSSGKDILDFTVRMRVSTHPAHKTKQSQENKKAEKAELAKIAGKKRVAPLPIIVVVNDESEEFMSYLDAIAYLDMAIAHAVEIMIRRAN